MKLNPHDCARSSYCCSAALHASGIIADPGPRGRVQEGCLGAIIRVCKSAQCKQLLQEVTAQKLAISVLVCALQCFSFWVTMFQYIQSVSKADVTE